LSVLPSNSELKPASHATWLATRTDDNFDAARVIGNLKRARHFVDESLLQQYGQSGQPPINLKEVSLLAPWLESLSFPFVDYESFAKIRDKPRYVSILTFTTPAIACTGDVAFLEVWTEDGRHANMGAWWWIQMRLDEGIWKSDWKHIRAIS
jgi:hypothetical protein